MNEKQTDIISPDTAGTLPGLFRERARRTPDATAYIHYDDQTGDWEKTSWKEMMTEVIRWQKAMEREGLAEGDRVAVMIKNCREWAMFDLAGQGLGLVIVPLYHNDSAQSAAYIMADSGSRLVLLENEAQWKALAPQLAGSDNIKRVITLAPPASGADERLAGADSWAGSAEGEFVVRQSDPDSLATIVYTSGTTDKPKGVMLSHLNILMNTASSLKSVSIYPDDVFLSFLPLSHTLERTDGYYLPIMAGATVAYARSIPQLGEDLLVVKPTVFISVPRIFERVYAKITTQLKEKPAIARKLFDLAVEVGWRKFQWEQKRAPWGPSLLLWPVLRALVAGKVLAKMGGKVRFVVSGGAPLNQAVAKVFIGLGLPIVQGYGLTETSPVIGVNQLEDNQPESIGRPLDCVQVRTGEKGELQVNGPCVMKGYWNNPADTAKMYTDDGWLKTGDKADIRDGRIYITGRLKEIIVLSTGEKAPPADMEMAIEADPVFDKVMVTGDRRPFILAIASLDNDKLKDIAEKLNLDITGPDGLPGKELEGELLRRISKLTERFPAYARPRRVLATLDEWTVEDAMITPTLKLKRSNILQRYKDEVDRIYNETTGARHE